MRSLLKLIRYKNLLMVLLMLVLTKYALLASTEFSWLTFIDFIGLTLIILLTTAAGYILNDIFDIVADKINKPEKVYISNTISVKRGWFFYWSFTVIAIVLALLLSKKPIHYSLFFGAPILLYLYSKFFKKIIFIGNLIISILVATPIYLIFIFEIIAGQPENLIFGSFSYDIVYFYMAFAFLTTLIREIIKDIEDIDGDLKIKAKTLPVLFGRTRAAKVAFFFSAVLLVFLLVVFKFFKNDVLFLSYGIVFMLLPLSYFMYKLWITKSKKEISKLSSLMKIIMFFGILSMLLFKT
jgi:4-hydroxybenzoate polyprenyltransferase